MNIPLFLSIFVGLGIVYLLLGVWTSKKISTTEDFFLAGRDLGFAVLTLTLIATQIGSGMLLGSADMAYRTGYYGLFYSLGMSIGFLLLSFGFASKLRSFNVSTIAELFETKYNSPFLRKVVSLISAATMTGLIAGQVIGSRSLFVTLGVGNEWWLIGFWAFVIAYTMLGGLKAVVVTDIVQVIFLITVVTGIFVYAVSGEGFSFFTPGAFVGRQSFFNSSEVTLMGQLSFLITPVLYSLFGQDLAQRFFSARSKAIAVSSAFAAGIIMLAFSFIPVYFGMKAQLMGMHFGVGSNVFIGVVGTLTNDLVLALIACGLVAAITSTADSLLCALSSHVAQDFGVKFASQRSQLFFSQVVTAATGFFAMFVAYYSQDILQMLTKSYGILISGLFVSVFFCFFARTFKTSAAVLSIVAGLSSFILFEVFGVFVHDIVALSACLGISLFGYGIGYAYDVSRQMC